MENLYLTASSYYKFKENSFYISLYDDSYYKIIERSIFSQYVDFLMNEKLIDILLVNKVKFMKISGELFLRLSWNIVADCDYFGIDKDTSSEILDLFFCNFFDIKKPYFYIRYSGGGLIKSSSYLKLQYRYEDELRYKDIGKFGEIKFTEFFMSLDGDIVFFDPRFQIFFEQINELILEDINAKEKEKTYSKITAINYINSKCNENEYIKKFLTVEKFGVSIGEICKIRPKFEEKTLSNGEKRYVVTAAFVSSDGSVFNNAEYMNPCIEKEEVDNDFEEKKEKSKYTQKQDVYYHNGTYYIASKDVRKVFKKILEINRDYDKVLMLFDNQEDLFPRDINGEILDLSEYDPSVIGFERIRRYFSENVKNDISVIESKNDFLLFRSKIYKDKYVKVYKDEIGEFVCNVVDSINNYADNEHDVVVNWKNDVIEIPVQKAREFVSLASKLSSVKKEEKEENTKPSTVSDNNSIYAAVIDFDKRQKVSQQTININIDVNQYFLNLDSYFKNGVKLLKHQKEGIEHMLLHLAQRKGGILQADAMGLGKTLQTLCLACLWKHHQELRYQANVHKPILIVCPLILVENWHNECFKFFVPETFPRILMLTTENVQQFRKKVSETSSAIIDKYELDINSIRDYDLVITNYDFYARWQIDLLKISWGVVVFDESHNIKNCNTYKARAALATKAEFCVCISGTPIENHLSELWTQIEVLRRYPSNPLKSYEDFCKIANEGGENIKQIHEILKHPSKDSPIIRRENYEISLPKLHTHMHYVSMTCEQTNYEKVLKLFSNDKNIIQKIVQFYQHHELVFSDDFCKNLAEKNIDVKDVYEKNPKIQKCLEIVEQVRKAGEKCIIFTWTRPMQSILQLVMKDLLGIDVFIINGDSNKIHVSKNDKYTSMYFLKKFEESPNSPAIILSPLVAGAGLNITCANHVIHYGRWWNPAKEAQATARVYRIGQTREVHVHYIILHHYGDKNKGFDLKLHELCEKKSKLLSDFLVPTELLTPTKDEFFALFGEE